MKNRSGNNSHGQQSSKAMLVVLYGAAFISAFNENVINVALYDIMSAFNVSSLTAQWLVTGYMIVTSIVVMSMAFLSQRFTLCGLFFFSAGCFIAGEACCLVAPTFPALLAARLLQAVGSGIFIPLMMNTALLLAPREKVGTYLAVGSAAITLGPAFAPVVSGVAVTYFGWRSIFVVPLVAGIILLVVGMLMLHNITEAKKVKTDVPSLALSAAGLTLLVWGLSKLTTDLLTALIMIGFSLVCITLFIRRQNTLEHPMLDVRPLGDKRFSVSLILVVIAMMTTFSLSVLLPLYFEGAFGCSALVAGALLLPAIVVNALTAIGGGRIMDRRGPWPLIPAGFACVVVGQFVIAVMSASLALVVVVAASVVVYAGVGLMMSPSQTAGLRVLSREKHASGVSIINTLIMVSASLGPSLFVGVLSSTEASSLAAGAQQSMAVASGFSSAVLLAAAIAVFGLVVAVVYSWKNKGVFVPSAVVAQQGQQGGEKRDQAGEEMDGDGKQQSPISDTPLLSQVMKRDAYVVHSHASIAEVARILVAHKTSGVPVINAACQVVGFISDGDIMRALAPRTQQVDLGRFLVDYLGNDELFSERVEKLLAANVMDYATKHVLSATLDEPLEQVCGRLSERRIKKMPVIKNGVLVGSISRSDVVRYLMKSFVAE